MKKTVHAKEQTEISEEREKVELSALGALAKSEGKGIEEKYLEEELTSYIGKRNIDYLLVGTGPFFINCLDTGKVYVVNTNGKVSEELVITASDIANNPILFYGAYVKDYDCINKDAVSSWQIFYADDENIYLIADNRINVNYVPNTSSGKKVATIGENQVYFGSNVRNSYNGSQDITDQRILKWYEYAKKYSESSIVSNKYTAYLLDTNVWNVFAGDKAEYAIGAPTIELFAASYNDINDVKISYEIADKGYSVKTDGEEYSERANIEDIVRNMYKTGYYWLSSPSISNYLSAISSEGIVYCDYTYTVSSQPGLRPVVCLKKDVKLKLEMNEGIFTIM